MVATTLSAPFIRTPLTLASLLAGKPALIILTYHRVLAEPDPMLASEPDAALFAAQMEFLARYMVVLPLSEAVERLEQGTLPRRAVAITFDDGYANNERVALPILRRVGLPATFFVATGYLDGGCMWNDAIIETFRRCPGERLDLRPLGLDVVDVSGTQARRRAQRQLIDALKYESLAERTARTRRLAELAGVELPRDLMMTSAEVRSLHRAGMEIGGHTVRHPILARIPDEEAREEIAQCRRHIAAITGTAPATFAYPNGRPGQDYLPQHVAMVREAGFSLAVSTASGCASVRSPRYELPRLALWSRSTSKLLANLALMYGRESLAARSAPRAAVRA